MEQVITIADNLITEKCSVCGKDYYSCWSNCVRKAKKVTINGKTNYVCMDCYHNLVNMGFKI